MEKGAWLQIGRGKTSRPDRRENDDQITNQSRGPTIMGVLPWQGDSQSPYIYTCALPLLVFGFLTSESVMFSGKSRMDQQHYPTALVQHWKLHQEDHCWIGRASCKFITKMELLLNCSLVYISWYCTNVDNSSIYDDCQTQLAAVLSNSAWILLFR